MGFVYKKGQTSYGSGGGNKNKGGGSSAPPTGGGPHGSNKKGKGPDRSKQRIKKVKTTKPKSVRPGYGGSKTDTPKSGSGKSGSDIGKEIDRAIADRQKNTGILGTIKDKVMNTIMNQGDWKSDPNALNKKTWLRANTNLGGQHKLRTQYDRLRAKYGPGWEKTTQAKQLANYLSGVAVERGGGLGAQDKNYGLTGDEAKEFQSKLLLDEEFMDAENYRQRVLNQFGGKLGTIGTDFVSSDFLKGLNIERLREGLSPEQYFNFRQQLMAADPTAGNQLYKSTFPWSSGYGVRKFATPLWSTAKGILGIEDKPPQEWADWRANQRIFEDTSTPVYGQGDGIMNAWQNPYDRGDAELEIPEEDEDDAVDLTPTPTPFPTYGTGIAGLDWSQFGPQFGPQYPGHYSNQGIQPNFSKWYDNLNKYYG